MQNKMISARARKNTLISSVMAALTLVAHGVGHAETAAASSSAADSGALQEIVVTALRVETTAQRTPAALEVIDSDQLLRQQIVQFSDLNNILSNTQIVTIVGATQVAIRGIVPSFIDPRADNDVATSINGLYFVRALPLGFGFLDVSRLEVLAGPQGTLYGRNSAAGALNIITNQPTNEFEGNVQATYGNFDEKDIRGVVNLPITDQLSVRIAADRDRRDGYIGDYYQDVNNDTARISALWTPSDKFSIYLESDYVKIGGNGGWTSSWPCASSVPWSLYIPKACPPPGFASYADTDAPKTGTTGSFVTVDQLHVNIDLGWAELTSISGFVGTHERFYNLPNGVFFLATDRTDNDDYSQEIRLTGRDNASHQGGLAWQAGMYFFQSSGDYFYHTQLPGSNLPPTGTTIYNDLPQSSQAAYAQLTYGVTDRLRVTGGLRYVNDFKGITYSTYAYLPPTFTTFAQTSGSTTSYAGDKVIWKTGIEYDLAPENLLYGNVSSGYLSGGVNGGNPEAPLPVGVTPAVFQPETITAYEIGSKNRFLNDRLQLNGDLYYYDFHNYQYLYPSTVQGGGNNEGLTIQNAASATEYGVELSAVFAATSNDKISASFAWTKSYFGPLSLNFFPPPFGPPIVIVSPAGGEFANDPEWSGLLGYEHTWRLAQGSSVTLSANSRISGKYLLVIGSTDPYDYQNSYTMTDASLAYHWPNDKYVARLWVKNIENSPVNDYGQGATFHLYEIEAPRTYGITLSAKF
jgi:iron complex outermembrane recepter protein